MHKKDSFTLLELLIVMSVISILATILLVILKPQEIFSKARDVERITDLTNYEKNIKLALLEPDVSNIGEVNVIYLSLQDTVTSCNSYISDLPTLPDGWSYKCSNTPQNANGTGWLPVNFSSSSVLNIKNLNIDPTNKPPYYYSYVSSGNITTGNFELTTYLEYQSNRATTSSASSNDGGTNLALYETGSNKTITPITFEEERTSEQSIITAGIWTVRDSFYGILVTDPAPSHDGNLLTSINLTAWPTANYYIEQDFQQSIVINKFKINIVRGAEPADILVEYHNGANWTFVGIITTNGWSEFSSSFNATKWRIGITNAFGGEQANVYEIEAFSP